MTLPEPISHKLKALISVRGSLNFYEWLYYVQIISNVIVLHHDIFSVCRKFEDIGLGLGNMQ